MISRLKKYKVEKFFHEVSFTSTNHPVKKLKISIIPARYLTEEDVFTGYVKSEINHQEFTSEFTIAFEKNNYIFDFFYFNDTCHFCQQVTIDLFTGKMMEIIDSADEISLKNQQQEEMISKLTEEILNLKTNHEKEKQN